MLTDLAAARTLTLLKGDANGSKDVYGNDLSDWTPIQVAGCAWWPSSTSETFASGDRTSSSYGVMFPTDTAVTAIDRVILPDVPGVWSIEGDPRQHFSPITGTVGGLGAWLKKVT